MVIRVSTIFDYKVVVALTIVLVVRTCNALAIGDKIVAQCVIHTIFCTPSRQTLHYHFGDYERANAET